MEIVATQGLTGEPVPAPAWLGMRLPFIVWDAKEPMPWDWDSAAPWSQAGSEYDVDEDSGHLAETRIWRESSTGQRIRVTTSTNSLRAYPVALRTFALLTGEHTGEFDAQQLMNLFKDRVPFTARWPKIHIPTDWYSRPGVQIEIGDVTLAVIENDGNGGFVVIGSRGCPRPALLPASLGTILGASSQSIGRD